jgi:O-acetyl-ADP-ribose deacetylase (regulator of RNase III)
MGGGVAGAIKRVGGREIEQEAVKQAPIPIGTAVATTAGSLSCRYVLHAPTMEQPAMRIAVDNVEKATHAALQLAEELHLHCIALPGMGTGVGGVSPRDAATAMVSIIKQYADRFETIMLVDRNDDMIAAFQQTIKEK